MNSNVCYLDACAPKIYAKEDRTLKQSNSRIVIGGYLASLLSSSVLFYAVSLA
ncbi:MAG: hypothetical protein E6713_05760 [Sporomusaceae bacterium]|nr:hypothetical protein [Sporomusaceae bacterium]